MSNDNSFLSSNLSQLGEYIYTPSLSPYQALIKQDYPSAGISFSLTVDDKYSYDIYELEYRLAKSGPYTKKLIYEDNKVLHGRRQILLKIMKEADNKSLSHIHIKNLLLVGTAKTKTEVQLQESFI